MLLLDSSKQKKLILWSEHDAALPLRDISRDVSFVSHTYLILENTSRLYDSFPAQRQIHEGGGKIGKNNIEPAGFKRELPGI
ncbi:TPA: hypothetical protein DDW35_05595 [Candidatus Sumerlaeota bacterium]|nr:hypothetical protein [Candidatus Sumerlaeota bacterium]